MRRELAADLVGELEAVDGKLKALNSQLRRAVGEYGSGLMGLYGLGPATAARILADVGDPARFPTRAHFASCQ